VLEAGEAHAALALGAGDVVADLDDGGDCLACLAEELQAHGADVRRHAVHHPARGGDDAVATFPSAPRAGRRGTCR